MSVYAYKGLLWLYLDNAAPDRFINPISTAVQIANHHFLENLFWSDPDLLEVIHQLAQTIVVINVDLIAAVGAIRRTIFPIFIYEPSSAL